jgi:hypothetical protein
MFNIKIIFDRNNFKAIALFIAVIKFSRHFKFPTLAFWILVGFFVCLAMLVVMSEVLRITEITQQHIIQGIEMKTRNRGSEPTPSDTYYYQTQRHTQEKVYLFIFLNYKIKQKFSW